MASMLNRSAQKQDEEVEVDGDIRRIVDKHTAVLHAMVTGHNKAKQARSRLESQKFRALTAALENGDRRALQMLQDENEGSDLLDHDHRGNNTPARAGTLTRKSKSKRVSMPSAKTPQRQTKGRK